MIPPASELRYIALEKPSGGQLESALKTLDAAVSAHTTGLAENEKQLAATLKDTVRRLYTEGEQVNVHAAKAVVKYWVKATWDRDIYSIPGSGEMLSFRNQKDNDYHNRERVLPNTQQGYLEFQQTGILKGKWRLLKKDANSGVSTGGVWITDDGTHSPENFPKRSLGALKKMRTCGWYVLHRGQEGYYSWYNWTIPALQVVVGTNDNTAPVPPAVWPNQAFGTVGTKVSPIAAITAIKDLTALEAKIISIVKANPDDEELTSGKLADYAQTMLS